MEGTPAQQEQTPRNRFSSVVCRDEVGETVSRLIGCLRDVLESPIPKGCTEQDAAGFPEFAAFQDELFRLREFACSVSQGDLSTRLAMRGYLSGVFKSLQANLAHLTWQTQTIASGDLTQRVDFLGEFSTAFNSMVRTLEENRVQIQHKEEELRAANERLLAEVAEKTKAQEKLQLSQQRFRSLAMRDALSGLFNRRYFFLIGRREIKRALRSGSPLALVLFDIDHFKRLNDTLGHAAGDEAIRAIGRITRQAVRDVDLTGRYGGEEFVVLLPGCDRDMAVGIAERLREAIAGFSFTYGDAEVRMTASFGVAVLPENFSRDKSEKCPRMDALAALADQALYRAKALGRDRIVTA